MKIRFVGLLLFSVLMLSLLSSCMGEPPIEEKAAPIYTLYTIADATPEAIREVELAINRLLFFRIGVCVDIVAVSEDEYDELIEEQFALVEEFTATKKDNKKKDESSEDESLDEEKDVLTGERLIEMMEKGEDIHPKDPRLDIFLVRGYDNYLKYASEGKLVSIEDKLTSEAKLLTDYIHNTFFEAAKINKKIYGVPINREISEYKYLVFDKELLDKYNFDAKTMASMEDLEEYLALIKENEPDVVPLENALDSVDFNFMFEDGFPAYVSSGGVVEPSYEDNKLLNYYARIARYRSLGYFGDEIEDENKEARYAVSFVTGNELDIAELSKTTGIEYDYSVYQKPVANNQNTIENLYCVSKFAVSNEIVDVMRIITQLYTDADVQNIFSYGIYGENYAFTDKGQVRRLNEDYMINPEYTGNHFIAHTLDGEDVNKWDIIKTQNFDSIASKLLGFNLLLDKYTYTDEDSKTQTIYEPDYIDIIQNILDKYYPQLITGSTVEIDIDVLKAETTELVMEQLTEDLVNSYSVKLSNDYAEKTRKTLENSAKAKKLRQEAEDDIWRQLLRNVKNILEGQLKSEYREEYGDELTNDEIEEMVEATLTEDYLWENRFIEYSEDEVEELIQAQYENEIEFWIDEEIEAYLESSSYENAIKQRKNSSEFKDDLEESYRKYGHELTNDLVDEHIAEILQDEIDAMLEEINTELENAVKVFIEEYGKIILPDAKESELLDLMLIEIGYKRIVKDGDNETVESPFTSYFEFVLTAKIQKQYYALYPLPKN